MSIKYKIKTAWWNFKARCQRFKRGFARSDVWEINTWFIDTIAPMLKIFKEKHNGYPGCFDNPETWDNILQEMIDCLEYMDEIKTSKKMGYDFDNMTLAQHREVQEKMTKNKDKFFKLFSEWFYDLWD